MDPLFKALSKHGLGQATSGVYELLKGFGEKPLGRPEIRELQSRINMHGVLVRAETLVSNLAGSGYVSIQRHAISDDWSRRNGETLDALIRHRLGESENVSFKAPE